MFRFAEIKREEGLFHLDSVFPEAGADCFCRLHKIIKGFPKYRYPTRFNSVYKASERAKRRPHNNKQQNQQARQLRACLCAVANRSLVRCFTAESDGSPHHKHKRISPPRARYERLLLRPRRACVVTCCPDSSLTLFALFALFAWRHALAIDAEQHTNRCVRC